MSLAVVYDLIKELPFAQLDFRLAIDQRLLCVSHFPPFRTGMSVVVILHLFHLCMVGVLGTGDL